MPADAERASAAERAVRLSRAEESPEMLSRLSRRLAGSRPCTARAAAAALRPLLASRLLQGRSGGAACQSSAQVSLAAGCPATALCSGIALLFSAPEHLSFLQAVTSHGPHCCRLKQGAALEQAGAARTAAHIAMVDEQPHGNLRLCDARSGCARQPPQSKHQAVPVGLFGV